MKSPLKLFALSCRRFSSFSKLCIITALTISATTTATLSQELAANKEIPAITISPNPAIEKASSTESTCLIEQCFPNQVSIADSDGEGEEQQLNLVGASQYTYWGFRLYHAAFYAPRDTSSHQAKLGEYPKLLTLRYARDFSAQDFIESGEAFLEKSVDLSAAEISAPLGVINSFYEPIKKGEAYTLAYLPRRGIALFKDERYIGLVPSGKQFAAGYFGIWLGENSLGKSFTRELLGMP